MIRDDFVEKSETEEDFVEEKGGNPFGSNGFLGRAKNYPLSKPMVYHDHERVEASRDREVRDKIAGDLLKRARGDGLNGREGGHGGVCVNLVLLAKSTAFNIAADVGGKAGPPEFSCDQLASFQEAGMIGGFMIMAALEDGATEGVICGDVDATFVRKDAGLDLPVSQARTEREMLRLTRVEANVDLRDEDEGVS